MLEIHVLNVYAGDSLILKSEHEGRVYHSIIDCKKVESGTPTVDFLRDNDITDISAIFITHLHQDHCSGLPDLFNYLDHNNGTLNYFIAPNLPEEEQIKNELIKCKFSEDMRPRAEDIFRAMMGLTGLPTNGIAEANINCCTSKFMIYSMS